MRMLHFIASLAISVLLLTLAHPAHAGEKKEGDKDILFGKVDGLTDKDETDTKAELSKSHRKVYKVKLTEGQAYRIELSSKDFDTFLRLENSAGVEVAFNDDIDLGAKNLDSRIVYHAKKSGEYRIIVTTYEPAKTGLFILEMKKATEAEAKEALFNARVEDFAGSPRAEQTKLLDEVTKGFKAKGEDLTIKDAQLAAQIFFTADDTDAAFLREFGESFAKIFESASRKQVAGLAPAIRQSLRSLDKLGKELDIKGMTIAGKDFELKNLKGKVVLVDFWGTWCGPCVAEMPNVVRMYEKYHAKGFEVIGIAADKNDEIVKNFLDKRKIPWACINIEDSRTMMDNHGVNSFPTAILVGADGRTLSYRARGPQLERLLDRLLATKK